MAAIGSDWQSGLCGTEQLHLLQSMLLRSTTPYFTFWLRLLYEAA
jgi:hypothetical protein